jgi:hypothetical protein
MQLVHVLNLNLRLLQKKDQMRLDLFVVHVPRIRCLS